MDCVELQNLDPWYSVFCELVHTSTPRYLAATSKYFQKIKERYLRANGILTIQDGIPIIDNHNTIVHGKLHGKFITTEYFEYRMEHFPICHIYEYGILSATSEVGPRYWGTNVTWFDYDNFRRIEASIGVEVQGGGLTIIEVNNPEFFFEDFDKQYLTLRTGDLEIKGFPEDETWAEYNEELLFAYDLIKRSRKLAVNIEKLFEEPLKLWTPPAAKNDEPNDADSSNNDEHNTSERTKLNDDLLQLLDGI